MSAVQLNQSYYHYDSVKHLYGAVNVLYKWKDVISSLKTLYSNADKTKHWATVQVRDDSKKWFPRRPVKKRIKEKNKWWRVKEEFEGQRKSWNCLKHWVGTREFWNQFPALLQTYCLTLCKSFNHSVPELPICKMYFTTPLECYEDESYTFLGGAHILRWYRFSHHLKSSNQDWMPV